MAYLIFYLRSLFKKDKNSRIIIFSQVRQLKFHFTRLSDLFNSCSLQWDSLLTTIGETLKENNITNVFVKGNVFVRNRAITKFRVSHLCPLQSTTHLRNITTFWRHASRNRTRLAWSCCRCKTRLPARTWWRRRTSSSSTRWPEARRRPSPSRRRRLGELTAWVRTNRYEWDESC